MASLSAIYLNSLNLKFFVEITIYEVTDGLSMVASSFAQRFIIYLVPITIYPQFLNHFHLKLIFVNLLLTSTINLTQQHLACILNH